METVPNTVDLLNTYRVILTSRGDFDVGYTNR